jgi:hypothetical protein
LAWTARPDALPIADLSAEGVRATVSPISLPSSCLSGKGHFLVFFGPSPDPEVGEDGSRSLISVGNAPLGKFETVFVGRGAALNAA